MKGTLTTSGHVQKIQSENWSGMVSANGYRGLVFDCDGTLLLSEDAHFAAFCQALEIQDATFERSWYDRRTGLDRHALMANFASEFAPHLNVVKAVDDSVAAYIGQDRPLPIVEPVIALARTYSDLPLFVGTNSARAIATASLIRAGIADMFNGIVAVDDVARPKPAPDIFLQAAHLSGLAPREILVVEDSIQGVEAAKRAGMDVLLIG